MRMKGMATKPSREYFEVSKYWLKLPLKFYNFFNLVKNKNGPNHYEINVGNKPEQITFKNTLDNLPIKSEKIFLKIDIENDEYTLLNDILKYSYLFTGLVIEFHRAKDNILEIPAQPNRFRIRAGTSLDQFNNFFSTKFCSDNVETIGGFVTDHLGHVPRRGEKTEIDNVAFEIQRADARRVYQLVVDTQNLKPELRKKDEKAVTYLNGES